MGVNELGEELFKVRKMKGLTLAAVAAKAGCSAAYLQKLERGEVQAPSPHQLHGLAKALEVPYEELMSLAGYLRPRGEQDGEPRAENLLAVALKGEPLTDEEASALAEYLAFFRSQRKAAT